MKKFEYNKKLAMKEGTKVKETKCFRCGEGGHGAKLIPEGLADQFDPGDFPTLDQARDMASGVIPVSSHTSKLFTPRLVEVMEAKAPEATEQLQETGGAAAAEEGEEAATGTAEEAKTDPADNETS